MSFQRLIRFKDSEGKIQCGDLGSNDIELSRITGSTVPVLNFDSSNTFTVTGGYATVVEVWHSPYYRKKMGLTEVCTAATSSRIYPHYHLRRIELS